MKTVYVVQPGGSLRREGELLRVLGAGVARGDVPLHDVDQLVLVGSLTVSAGAMDLLLDRGVDVVLLTRSGRFRGRLGRGVSTNVTLRLRQAHLLSSADSALALARTLVAAKARSERRLLLRHAREHGDSDTLRAACFAIRASSVRVQTARTLDEARGCEGAASSAYFRVFGELVRAPGFRFDGRSRRPPMDPVNALLSLGYTLLTSAVESALHVVGLDPYVGALHAPLAGRPSLACDLVEEARAPFVDALVLAAIHQGAVKPDDFEDGGPGEAVVVRPEALRWFVTLFERRLERRLRYPPLGKKLSWRDVLEQQARLMARHVLGKGEYVPFEPD